MSISTRLRHTQRKDAQHVVEHRYWDGEVLVATASRTGEYGRDNYPWEWRFEQEGLHLPSGRASGTTDTLREAADIIQTHWDASPLWWGMTS